MTPHIDLGLRCEAHVGEAFPPRCADCEAANQPVPRTGYIPGAECPTHPGYPVPCDRCDRDRADGIPTPAATSLRITSRHTGG